MTVAVGVSGSRSPVPCRSQCRLSGRPAAETLDEGQQYGFDVLEGFHAAFGPTQRDCTLCRRDNGYGQSSCWFHIHSAGHTEFGEQLSPGPKDGAGVVEKIVVVRGDRDGHDGASSGEMGTLQHESPQGEKTLH